MVGYKIVILELQQLYHSTVQTQMPSKFSYNESKTKENRTLLTWNRKIVILGPYASSEKLRT